MTGNRKEAPLSTDWCNSVSPPCDLANGTCGIKQWLRDFPLESRQEKAKWLKEIAQEDRDRFIKICESGLYDLS